MKRRAIALVLAVATAALAQQAGIVNNLRGPTPLGEETKPAPLPKPVNDDQRRARSYPAQPPVIPHQIDNYQVDLRFNKCMDCHGRSRTGESQAPMVSVTHYQDRDGQLRQEISPRRYFCTGCHVPQADVRPPVKNTFQDFYDVRADAPPPKKGAKK
jgi:cytochrome c-type protein NapB